MISMFDPSRLQHILCLGAHGDDIEIGCGGTVLRIIDANSSVEITWVVLGGDPERQAEARASADEFLPHLPKKSVHTHSFRDAFFPSDSDRIKDSFEQLKVLCDPDLIFTHYRDDLHQDHRVVNQLTWNTFRRHVILEYEIVKYDGDLGQPNMYCPIDASTLHRKVAHLMKHFGTQRGKQWYDEEVFRGLARIRGVECDSPTRYAEGFHVRKLRM